MQKGLGWTSKFPGKDVACGMTSSNCRVVGRNGKSRDSTTLDSFSALTNDTLESLVVVKDQNQTFGCANGDGGWNG
jgi:hypothetical protein